MTMTMTMTRRLWGTVGWEDGEWRMENGEVGKGGVERGGDVTASSQISKGWGGEGRRERRERGEGGGTP